MNEYYTIFSQKYWWSSPGGLLSRQPLLLSIPAQPVFTNFIAVSPPPQPPLHHVVLTGEPLGCHRNAVEGLVPLNHTSLFKTFW